MRAFLSRPRVRPSGGSSGLLTLVATRVAPAVFLPRALMLETIFLKALFAALVAAMLATPVAMYLGML
jgi:hypothetical protein